MKKDKKKIIKSLCKLSKKEVETNLDKIVLLVKNPTHICIKCGRAANDDGVLCNPVVMRL